MPCCKRNGAPEVAFASQKQYVALYLGKGDAVNEFRDALNASSIGKSCIRFSKPEQMDFEVIDRLLRRIMESKPATC